MALRIQLDSAKRTGIRRQRKATSGRLASIFSRPSIRMGAEESSNERNACLATELPNRTWVTNQCRIVKAIRPW